MPWPIWYLSDGKWRRNVGDNDNIREQAISHYRDGQRRLSEMDKILSTNMLRKIPDAVRLSEAIILWNSMESGPAFAIRPLGHDDYYEYDYQAGACFANWRKQAEDGELGWLLNQVLALMWQAVIEYGCDPNLVHEEMMRIPEYGLMFSRSGES